MKCTMLFAQYGMFNVWMLRFESDFARGRGEGVANEDCPKHESQT